MKGKGWTQVELASEAGLLNSRVGNYIQGLRELPIREAKALGAALNVPAAYLFGVVDEIDRDVLAAPLEKKKHFLALLGGDTPHKPDAGPATEEAQRPAPRSKKSGRWAAKTQAA